jgi:hypothetical protein
MRATLLLSHRLNFAYRGVKRVAHQGSSPVGKRLKPAFLHIVTTGAPASVCGRRQLRAHRAEKLLPM